MPRFEEEPRALPEAPAPRPGHPRFPLLDSLRAIAAISVLLVHVGIFTGGFSPWYKRLFAQLDIGVPFFFLLSGFLLYRPMLAARLLALPKQSTASYARNRFFRVIPAYWIALTVAAIVPGFDGAFTKNWWVYYGLLQNFPVYTSEGTCAVNPFACGLPPAWSLSVEILFYLTLPLFSVAMARLQMLLGRRHWVAIELAALGLLTIASLFVQSSVPRSEIQVWLFFSPIGRGWWFALGLGLAVLSVYAQTREHEPAIVRWIGDRADLWWITAGGLYVIATIFVLEPGPSLAFPIISPALYLFSCIIFGIISALVTLPALFGFERGGKVRRLLRRRALAWLGSISYGIFLWHFPVMILLLEHGFGGLPPAMQFPLLATTTFAMTVLLAALSYHLIERPLIRWSHDHSRL